MWSRAERELQTVNGPLLFGVLTALMTGIVFLGLWRVARSLDQVETRVKEYGLDGAALIEADGDGPPKKRVLWPRFLRLVNGLGMGPRLAIDLARADIPLTVAEFMAVMLGGGALGFLIGMWRQGLLLGLGLGGVLAYVPMIYLRISQKRRQRAFSEQLPDVLTMLVGALRAGYGLMQAMQLLVEHIPPPSSDEFARVMRAVGLGVSVQQALTDMAERVGTDELGLVVTAINVQYETGGNLAQTLEVISETIRDRIRIIREIAVFTAQQQLTGYMLAGLPLLVALAISMMSPGFFKPFLEPGWPRLLPIMAVSMQVVGFLIIRKIIDIEV